MVDTTHECPKNGCGARVRRSQLACPAHWRMVSPATQRAVYAGYRSGSVSQHVAAMQDAIDEMNHGEPSRPSTPLGGSRG